MPDTPDLTPYVDPLYDPEVAAAWEARKQELLDAAFRQAVRDQLRRGVA